MRSAFVTELMERLKYGEELYLLTGDVGWNAFDKLREQFPKNFYNIGLAEQSMVLIAIGMALKGKEVYTYSILPFSAYRTFEQIRLACYNNAPIRAVGMGVGYDYDIGGCTHFGLEDIQAMTSLPNITVVSPADSRETTMLLRQLKGIKGPAYIRLSKNSEPELHNRHDNIKIGQALRIMDGKDVLIVTTGAITKLAIEAARRLEEDGISCEILNMHTLKPFDGDSVRKSAGGKRAIAVIEENNGGLAKLVSIELSGSYGGPNCRFISFRLPDEFNKEVGRRDWMLERVGLKADAVYNKIKLAVE